MRLRYTLPALADLASILDHITDRSPQGAARIHARIQATTNLLLRYPWAGAPTDDPTIRRVVTTPYPYLVFYESNGQRNYCSRHPPWGTRPLRKSRVGLADFLLALAAKVAEYRLCIKDHRTRAQIAISILGRTA
jgi:toxin ParE1/3/4